MRLRAGRGLSSRTPQAISYRSVSTCRLVVIDTLADILARMGERIVVAIHGRAPLEQDFEAEEFGTICLERRLHPGQPIEATT